MTTTTRLPAAFKRFRRLRPEQGGSTDEKETWRFHAPDFTSNPPEFGL